MKALLKVLLGAFALLALAVAGLAVFIKVKFPPEKLKALVNEQAEKHLRRQVKLDSVSAGIWKGLSVTGFELSDSPDFAAGRFVASRSLSVKPFLLPLLKGEVIVKSIELDSPEIRLVRLPDGRFNFSDLSEAGPSTAAASPVPVAPPGAAPGAPTIFINSLNVRNGAVSFEDRSPAAMNLGVKALDLSVTGFSLTDPFSFRLSAEPLAGRLRMDGKLALAGAGALEFEADADISGTALSAAGAVRNFSAPELDVSVVLRSFEAKTLAPFAQLPPELSDAKASGTLSYKGTLAEGAVVSELKADAAGVAGNISASAQLKGLPDKPAFDAMVRFTDLVVRRPLAEGLSLSGPIHGEIKASGTPKDMKAVLDVQAKDAAVSYTTLFSKPAGAPLSFKADASVQDVEKIALKTASLTLGSLTVHARGTLDIAGAGRVDLAAQAPAADLKELGAYLPLIKEYGLSGAAGVNVAVKGPLDAPKASGTLTLKNVGAAAIGGIALTELTGNAAFTDDSLSTDDLKGKLNGSDLTLKAKVKNFARPDVWCEGNLASFDAGALMSAPAAPASPTPPAVDSPAPPPGGAPLARTAGTFRLVQVTHPQYDGRDFRLTWDLTEVGPDMSRSNGTAELTAADGRIHDVPIAAKLNKLLKKDTSEIPYEKMSGHFQVTQGVLATPDFTVTGDSMDILAQGTVSLVTLVADLRAVLKLPAGSVGGSASDWFAGEDGRPTLEATLKGPVTDPSIQVDLAKAAKRAAEDALRKGLEKLKRSYGSGEAPAEGAAAPAPTEREQQIDKALEKGQKALDKLFKKR